MGKIFLASLTAFLALAGCAGGSGPDRARPLSANPSAVIAVELAFAQLAQTKGQWTAFRETSTDEAMMFSPQPVNAHAFLKGRANPSSAVKWQPQAVWMSCDGSIGITRGAWQGPAGVGYLTTIWQRQSDGAYKWILDQGDTLGEAAPEPEMIAARVADCPKRGSPQPPRQVASVRPGLTVLAGASPDGTLVWETTVEPDGARNFSAALWHGGKLEDVAIFEFAAPAAP